MSNEHVQEQTCVKKLPKKAVVFGMCYLHAAVGSKNINNALLAPSGKTDQMFPKTVVLRD